MKLVLTRRQMYYGTGYRPETLQRVAMGASGEGRLVAIIHQGTAETSMYEEYVERLLEPARFLYSCQNVATSYRLAHLNVHTPIYMRGPGVASGIFALECANESAGACDRRRTVAVAWSPGRRSQRR